MVFLLMYKYDGPRLLDARACYRVNIGLADISAPEFQPWNFILDEGIIRCSEMGAIEFTFEEKTA